jgi:hypothetical protein
MPFFGIVRQIYNESLLGSMVLENSWEGSSLIGDRILRILPQQAFPEDLRHSIVTILRFQPQEDPINRPNLALQSVHAMSGNFSKALAVCSRTKTYCSHANAKGSSGEEPGFDWRASDFTLFLVFFPARGQGSCSRTDRNSQSVQAH